MSNFDRNAYGQYGGVRPADSMAIDQGLRSYMLGIYNHMVLGLAITGVVALGISMLGLDNPIVRALYLSPLKYVIMLAPLAFVMVLSFRFERMSYTALLGTFWAFAATMGLSMGWIFFVYKLGSVAQALFVTTASFGAPLFAAWEETREYGFRAVTYRRRIGSNSTARFGTKWRNSTPKTRPISNPFSLPTVGSERAATAPRPLIAPWVSCRGRRTRRFVRRR